jgi:hypothetical protein
MEETGVELQQLMDEVCFFFYYPMKGQKQSECIYLSFLYR